LSPFLQCGAKKLDLSRAIVMGVLNVTPDSFSDGGRYLAPAAACEHARRMIAEGAAIIDIGGESTRPGAERVPVQEELRRVLPVIEALADAPVVLSIDTMKPEVMRAAVRAGVGLINDVRALAEPGALAVALDGGCAVCLMHMQGEPRTMQKAPHYLDVVKEVKAFLHSRAHACEEAGIARQRILIDPGFGFGKTQAHNLELLRRLDELTEGPWPLAVGLSRKSMLGNILGRRDGDRLAAGVALAVLAVLRDARIIRAHDAAATVDALQAVAAVAGGAGVKRTEAQEIGT
jgi:dihydropteroate synthase